MITFKKIDATHAYAGMARIQGSSIGFVPTMGALHDGHLSLVRRAKEENDLVIVSIFVNPIQFNNAGDLEKYPRNLDRDIVLLESAGCDVVFAPDAAEMYPEPIEKNYDFGGLETVMEGAFRPGHFNGVAIVVDKLFRITLPHRAYFGEKDYQQLAIIQALVKQEKLDVEIVPCPIRREHDGLAMSSRNERLTEQMRAAAPAIYQWLLHARAMAASHTAGEIEKMVIAETQKNPLLRLEYFTIANEETLQAVTGRISPGDRAFIAVFAGDIRLIDNLKLI